MKAKSAQYTVRDVPAEVDRALRQRAAHARQSLNRLIVDELTRIAVGGRALADFSDLVGQWVPDKAFDAILAEQRTVDAAMWK